ncbi:MAG: GNAT family N-acetyltransferase [Candidatus Puniceispirillales bacterium WSBS_2018_MAG_OTU23]
MNDDQLFGKLVDYAPPPSPKDLSLNGAHAYLRPLTPTDAAELTANFNVDKNIWNYLSYGPFDQAEDYADWIIKQIATGEAYFYTIRLTATDQAVGVASYLRINPEAGSIEVGNINYSPALQSTIAATETMFLMMDWAFSNGYRRYEWKCNALNKKSRAAAQRLGFSFEGIFRQAAISKGRNRDTAWFGIIDQEYPALKSAFETWLLDDNFDADGQQIKRLSDLTKPIRVASDPAL